MPPRKASSKKAKPDSEDAHAKTPARLGRAKKTSVSEDHSEITAPTRTRTSSRRRSHSISEDVSETPVKTANMGGSGSLEVVPEGTVGVDTADVIVSKAKPTPRRSAKKDSVSEKTNTRTGSGKRRTPNVGEEISVSEAVSEDGAADLDVAVDLNDKKTSPKPTPAKKGKGRAKKTSTDVDEDTKGSNIPENTVSLSVSASDIDVSSSADSTSRDAQVFTPTPGKKWKGKSKKLAPSATSVIVETNEEEMKAEDASADDTKAPEDVEMTGAPIVDGESGSKMEGLGESEDGKKEVGSTSKTLKKVKQGLTKDKTKKSDKLSAKKDKSSTKKSKAQDRTDKPDTKGPLLGQIPVPVRLSMPIQRGPRAQRHPQHAPQHRPPHGMRPPLNGQMSIRPSPPVQMVGVNPVNGSGKAKEEKPSAEETLATLAHSTWGGKGKPHFKEAMVKKIYDQEIRGPKFPIRRLQVLEFSQYLEKYLWPNYNPIKASSAHVLSLCMMVNEKFRQGVPAWDAMTGVVTREGEVDEKSANSESDDQVRFKAFMENVRALTVASEDERLSMAELSRLVLFHINVNKSLEHPIVRQQVLPSVSLGIWSHVTTVRRTKELESSPRIAKQWKLLHKRLGKLDGATRATRLAQIAFIPSLLARFLKCLYETPSHGSFDPETVVFCERVVEYLIDMQSQLPTRRYTNLVLADKHVTTACMRSPMYASLGQNSLFAQLLASLSFYIGFEINNLTGTALSEQEMTELHYRRVRETQMLAFQHKDTFPELDEFALSNVASVDTPESIAKHMGSLSPLKLQSFLHLLCLVQSPDDEVIDDHTLLLAIAVDHLQRRTSQIDALNETPLYPAEHTLFDPSLVPDEYYSEGVLALPKLNLQFLTLHDYLLRNMNLYRLESTFEIREDVIDSVKRMPARLDGDGHVQFDGWSRMCLPTYDFSIIEVAKPELGQFRPRRIRADITIDLRQCRPGIALEWESLRKHDILFLCCVQPTEGQGLGQQNAFSNSNGKRGYDPTRPFMEQSGLRYVRGCEVEGMLGEDGSMLEEGPERPSFKQTTRTVRVYLDTNQYYQDIQSLNTNGQDVYGGINLVMRREAKENNFKAVLDTIRNLMNTECLVPEWLHDIFLGYGDPSMANYRNAEMKQPTRTFNVNDTFLDLKHLKESFPEREVYCVVDEDDIDCAAPFNIKLPDPADEGNPEAEKRIVVTPFKEPNVGPYPSLIPKGNTVRFTPVQTEAIVGAMHHGLTMVVGPPGTGKTDVAVQIISNWYHNNPDQRILLVTHSNMALNQLFEKLMYLNIDERHLLRLGFGERELDTEKEFTKYGRVNFILERRLKLLGDVQRLADSLCVAGDIGNSCETAGYFYLHNVLAKWEEYLSKVKLDRGTDGDVVIDEDVIAKVSAEFPFKEFFADAPADKMFKGEDYHYDIDVAEGCYRYLTKIFEELEGCRAFEIMRTQSDRVNYLLAKEAKIVAMTCTHAALKRGDLVKLGFNFDNILMEEAAQILEIETFIPMMCQDPSDGMTRLKRVVLIGDHHQLPPVIKNMAFQKFSNMEQSMFTRFIRLNVPAVHLDRQGRARSGIAELYKWRYNRLENLPHVQALPEFSYANAGFKHDYQFIDVGDFNGAGETEPTAHFVQNLGEAEYVVATYMYMRIMGYPAEKISVITTYNGQAALLRDVFKARCGRYDSPYGMPDKIATVDKFQGQQNDYVLLSLVRTKTIGHIRDVRRLVVALSRARLGLYVFGRASMFNNCFEIRQAMEVLNKRSTKMELVVGEVYPTQRKNTNIAKKNTKTINSVIEMHEYVEALAAVQNKLQQVQTQTQGDTGTHEHNQIEASQTQAQTRQQSNDGDVDMIEANATSENIAASDKDDEIRMEKDMD
eukprot:CFRG2995T1